MIQGSLAKERQAFLLALKGAGVPGNQPGWRYCISPLSSLCKPEALTSILHTYADTPYYGQPNNMLESSYLHLLPTSPLLLPHPLKIIHFLGACFSNACQYIWTNTEPVAPATPCVGFSHSRTLHKCLNHPLNQTNSPYVPEPAEIIQTGQS